jgi:uncharacterized membrane protein
VGVMGATYAVHIVTAVVGLIAGFVALYSAKGAVVHRKSGMVFVYGMVIMAVLGMTMAVLRDKAPDTNIPAGLLACYLVITSLATVRRPAEGSHPERSEGSAAWRWLDIGAMLVALTLGLTMLSLGLEALANGGKRHGVPAYSYFIFAAFALLGVPGDLHVIWSGARTGAARLARHLWRMSLALFLAALSGGVQLAKMLPKPVRLPVLLIPMLIVLMMMFYWLWRVRGRRSLRGFVVRAPEVANPSPAH